MGAYPYVTLAEPRAQALEYRRLARSGGDPGGGTTFRQAAVEVIDFHRPTWRSPKSAAQWDASLRDYAFPILGDKRVDEIRPHWRTPSATRRKPPTRGPTC